MSWNHRICKRKNKYKDPISKKDLVIDVFDIREVYYNKNGSIFAYMQNGIAPVSENIADLKWEIKMYQKAFKLPILDLDRVDKNFKKRKVEKIKKTYPYKGGK